ncbi:DUF6686 family protein [Chondrinema litorale]|uniref:DUF6686 family protein n=1 Tax=Chondrinema litorale TaxID=2994555 RepID=UPI002542E2B1|nr:DUF6686 family protein [Chondrinema litorale]UZR99460.1 hypothetical protein OQ292_36945 [Chondrinema litorale]
MSTSFKLIDENDYAYSAQCKKTAAIQMSFGNVCLKLLPKEFYQLKNCVENTLKGASQDKCPCCRNIVVSTSVANMAFMFSLQELSKLHHVMVNTSTILEIQNILKN